jgi:hypothetical protein
VLSINVGASVQGRSLPGIAQRAIVVKPLSIALQQSAHASSQVLVAGGGVAAIEIALVVRRKFRADVVLFSGSRGVLQSGPVFGVRRKCAGESAMVSFAWTTRCRVARITTCSARNFARFKALTPATDARSRRGAE